MAETESKNEKLVRSFFEDVLNTGDLEKIRPCFHPDATWTPMAKPGIPGAGVHRGRKGIVDEFLAPVRGLFVDGDPKNTVENLFGKGDFVAVETHGTGTFRNGRPLRQPLCLDRRDPGRHDLRHPRIHGHRLYRVDHELRERWPRITTS